MLRKIFPPELLPPTSFGIGGIGCAKRLTVGGRAKNLHLRRRRGRAVDTKNEMMWNDLWQVETCVRI